MSPENFVQTSERRSLTSRVVATLAIALIALPAPVMGQAPPPPPPLPPVPLPATPDPLPADDDEFLERQIVPVTEAVRMALGDDITESFSKLALLHYAAAGR